MCCISGARHSLEATQSLVRIAGGKRHLVDLGNGGRIPAHGGWREGCPQGAPASPVHFSSCCAYSKNAHHVYPTPPMGAGEKAALKARPPDPCIVQPAVHIARMLTVYDNA